MDYFHLIWAFRISNHNFRENLIPFFGWEYRARRLAIYCVFQFLTKLGLLFIASNLRQKLHAYE